MLIVALVPLVILVRLVRASVVVLRRTGGHVGPPLRRVTSEGIGYKKRDYIDCFRRI